MREYKTDSIKIRMPWGEMKLLILRSKKAREKKAPGILWLHGGGYAVGGTYMAHMSRAVGLIKKFGAVVVCPEYRLAGKAPYPAALEDCYAALLYLKNHAPQLGVDDTRLMVGGESAGGGLTAALCLYARDKGEVNISFQMPLYPMIDDRETESNRDNHGITWNSKRNRAAWKLYLRDVAGEIPAYAAPARAESYENLPPCYTFVGDREPFYSETLAYVEGLKKAGVAAHVDVYPTGVHAFDMLLPWRKISHAAVEEFEKQFVYALFHTAPQKEDKK